MRGTDLGAVRFQLRLVLSTVCAVVDELDLEPVQIHPLQPEDHPPVLRRLPGQPSGELALCCDRASPPTAACFHSYALIRGDMNTQRIE